MIGISQDRFIVRCDHNNKGGEVALIIKTNLKPKHIRINTILEILVVEISEPIHMIVISLYRPPSTPLDMFINNILHIITQLQNIPICIVGDFNEDLSITSNTHCCTTLRLQGFHQMISKQMHNRPFICITHMKYNTNRCDRLLLQWSWLHTMCHNSVIDMYNIHVKDAYRYAQYHMIYAHMHKIATKNHKCANIRKKCQFDNRSHYQINIHLKNILL